MGNKQRAPILAILAILAMAMAAAGCSRVGLSAALGPSPDASFERTVAGAEGPLLDHYFESFEDVFETQSLALVVRATDNVWQDRPPGADPAADKAYAARLPDDGTGVDTFFYLWREFEVVEVLRGDYDKPTINYGYWVDRTEAGKTYVVFAHVLMAKDGRYWRTDEDYSEGIPPYELAVDNALISTDPDVQQKLPPTLTLTQLREQIDG